MATLASPSMLKPLTKNVDQQFCAWTEVIHVGPEHSPVGLQGFALIADGSSGVLFRRKFKPHEGRSGAQRRMLDQLKETLRIKMIGWGEGTSLDVINS